MLPNIPNNKQLILFDGVCNLCNASVQFILKHDKNNRFVFASLQGETGTMVTQHYAINKQKIDSILLLDHNQKIHYKSTAALKIALQLGFPISLLYIFMLIPIFLRDLLYDYVAKNRYRWFGKKEVCFLPTPELKTKFFS